MPLKDHIDEIKRLRFECEYTLQEIGDVFGVSREAVRLVLGNTGYFGSSRKIKFSLNNPEKTNTEIQDMFDVSAGTVSRWRSGVFHAIDGECGLSKSYDWIMWISEILSGFGLEVEIKPIQSECNVLVNDITRINVRVCTKQWNPPSKRNTSPTYSFRISKKETCDIFLLIIAETKDVFVIPSEHIPDKIGRMIFVWPPNIHKRTSWQKYHERWDYLFRDIEIHSLAS